MAGRRGGGDEEMLCIKPICRSLQCHHMRTCKKISEDERIGEQEVEIWKEFFRQMLYQRMKMMEEEEMMLEVTQELFTKG